MDRSTLFRVALPCGLALLLASSQAAGQLLAVSYDYLSGSGRSFLYSVEPVPPTETSLGVSFSWHLSGLAYAPDGTLYGIQRVSSTNRLVQIDLETGILTVVGNLPSGNIGSLAISATGDAYTMAWFFSGDAEYYLYSLDLQTAGLTLIGASGLADPSVVPGPPSVQALTFHPNGALYAWVITPTENASVPGFYEIDLQTGVATRVGSTGGQPNLWGMEALPDGRVFGAGDGDFFEIDVATGVATQTGVIGPLGSPYWSAMTLASATQVPGVSTAAGVLLASLLTVIGVVAVRPAVWAHRSRKRAAG